jgi:hypothetical protein
VLRAAVEVYWSSDGLALYVCGLLPRFLQQSLLRVLKETVTLLLGAQQPQQAATEQDEFCTVLEENE